MKNLKIRTKLVIGFGITLLIMIVLSALSFQSATSLNETIRLYADKSVPNNTYVWHMRRNLVSMQRYLLLAISMDNANERNDAINNYNEDKKVLFDTLESFKKNQRVDKSYTERLEKEVNTATPYSDKIIELIQDGSPESFNKAVDIFVNSYKPAFDRAADVLIEISDIQQGFADTQEKTGVDTYHGVELSIVISLLTALSIVVLLTAVISKSIVSPVKELEQASKEIAKGNLNVNLRIHGKDEIGSLTESFIKLRNTILMLVEKINNLSEEYKLGDIEAKINLDEFEGEFKEVAISINTMVGDLINDTLEILGGYTKCGDGDFSAEIREFPGKKKLANDSFNDLKNSLKALSEDLTNLISAAINGKLDARINSEKYKGDWNKLTNGLNNLLEVINNPIDEANEILEKISQGDFEVSIDKNYKGSFASMMNSFERMIETTGSYISEISDILGKVSQGDLRNQINGEYVGQYDLIKKAINNICSNLTNTISEIKASADNVLMGSKHISESAMDLANGASIQASSLEELNASLVAINDQTHETAEKSQKANEFSILSSESARVGNAEMLDMLTSMDEIKEASKDISKIIKIIDDIAFQTNILALNAAVEAARAGQHGKGFAVVADEVRSLAGRSQQAAQDTSSLIEDTISKINQGTQTAKLTAESLQKIVEDTTIVSEYIDNIHVATREQTEGIAQITIGVNQISDVVQRNSSTSEESAAAAQELNSQSELLAQMVSKFKFN